MLMKDERFFKTIKNFLEIYLLKQKNYSKNTQKSYRESLSLLLQYFKEELGLGYAQIGFDDLTYTNVCGFLDWLTVSRGCSPQTVNLRLMAIRSFAKYSSIVDPAKIYFQVELANVPVKKAHGKVVEFMSLPALEALFLQPNTKKTTGFRDFCFMILMYDVAARCQELLDLRIGDLELQQNTPSVYLTGKGTKMRKLPISTKVAGHLKNYLNTAHPAISRKDEDFLFYTISHGHRNKMSSDAVSLFMRKYGETGKKMCSEIPDRVHPHQLRHSRAMHLYRGGMPLVLLSEFLGHADVNTTRIYAWADTEMKRQAIQKITDKCEANATIEPIWENDEQMIKRLYGLA